MLHAAFLMGMEMESNANWPYELTLIPCFCQTDVYAESLDWSLTPTGTVIPGRETEVSLDSNVMFQDGNREVAGTGLWRQGIYGSRNPDGSGEKFNYKRQTFDRTQSGTTVAADSDLAVSGATTNFEIGSVGCNDFGYVCVEFSGGDNPIPAYYFRTEGSTSRRKEDNTLTECKEQECLSSKHELFANTGTHR